MPGKALLLTLLLAVSNSTFAQEDDYFGRVDQDADGRISLDEFLLKMGWAFSQRDLNGDGILQPEEQHYPGAKPITIAEHRARFTRQFHRQDGNGDGYLSRREFLAPPQ